MCMRQAAARSIVPKRRNTIRDRKNPPRNVDGQKQDLSNPGRNSWPRIGLLDNPDAGMLDLEGFSLHRKVGESSLMLALGAVKHVENPA
jgi:hypothetical protein